MEELEKNFEAYFKGTSYSAYMKNQGIAKEPDGADADGTPSEYEWTRYPIVADYDRYYKENMHLFQDVHATYDAVMDALREEIDELSEDEEADTSDLEEDMERISEWYNGKFLREYGPQCSWDKVKEEYLSEVKKDTDIFGEVLRLSINLNYDWMDRLYGTAASTFSMNYKEYLMVFLAVRFTAKEGDAISCMGNLIESNAKKVNSQYYCGEDFSLVHAYTMIQIDAETRIKPVFLNLPRFNQNNEYFTKDTYPINYKGILGY